MLELRSRILGLTALNAELTRKIQSGVDETAAMKALESRNAELQQQLSTCNKEISGLQVCAKHLQIPVTLRMQAELAFDGTSDSA